MALDHSAWAGLYDATNMFALACRLLDYAVDDEPALARRDDSEVSIAAAAVVLDHVDEWAKPVDGRWAPTGNDIVLDATEIASLIDLLIGYTEELQPIVAHAAATAIDGRGGASFGEAQRLAALADGGWLTPGEWYPVGRLDLDRLRPLQPSPSRTALAEVRPWELTHIRRWAPVTRLRVRIDWSMDGALDSILDEWPPMASCNPTVAYPEDFSAGHHGPRRFPIAPKGSGHRAAVLHACSAALAVGARVLVFPELAVSPGDVVALRELVDHSEQPVLLVAGSVHLGTHPDDGAVPDLEGEPWESPRAGPARNEAFGWISGTTMSLRHRKFTRYAGKDAHGNRVVEGILLGDPQITVWRAGEWAVAIAICKDVLDDYIDDLADAGVNLLLVPALSRRCTGFDRSANQIRADNQGVTLVSNAAQAWSRNVVAAALFCLPIEGTASEYVRPQAGPEPGIAVLWPAAAEWEWFSPDVLVESLTSH